MKKYRIKAVRPDVYIVERKGWFFWHPYVGKRKYEFKAGCWRHSGYYTVTEEFKTTADAYNACRDLIQKEQKIQDHVSQKPIYFS